MEKDFEAFFKANERRIHYQVHRLGIKGEWYKEFYTEGLFALWKAYKEFDATQGEIGTFINYKIRYRLIDLLRKKLNEQSAVEKILNQESVRLDDGNRHRGSRMPVVKTNGIELENSHFWQEVHNRLSENQWKWVTYFIIAELTVKEIMEIEGVTADAVKGWGHEVRRKFRVEKGLKEKLEALL